MKVVDMASWKFINCTLNLLQQERIWSIANSSQDQEPSKNLQGRACPGKWEKLCVIGS